MGHTVSIIRFLIVLGILIFVHELGHFAVAKLSGVYVHRFALGFGPRLIGYRGKETDYCICAVPLGGYVKMAGQEDLPSAGSEEKAEPREGVPEVPPEREYYSKSKTVRTVLLLAGPAMNFFVGAFLLSATYYSGIKVASFEDTSTIGEVLKDTPAEKAGIKRDDTILTIDGEAIEKWSDIRARLVSGGGKNVIIALDRAGEKIEISVTPEESPDGGYRIGIAPKLTTEVVKFGAVRSVAEGFRDSLVICRELFAYFGRLVSGNESFKHLAGPVGIYQMVHYSAREGIANLINFVARISVCLFAFNVLPLPMLDGGHVVLNIIEVFRKKQLERRYMEIVQNVGFVLIVCLFVLVTYNDILRLFMK